MVRSLVHIHFEVDSINGQYPFANASGTDAKMPHINHSKCFRSARNKKLIQGMECVMFDVSSKNKSRLSKAISS